MENWVLDSFQAKGCVNLRMLDKNVKIQLKIESEFLPCPLCALSTRISVNLIGYPLPDIWWRNVPPTPSAVPKCLFQSLHIRICFDCVGFPLGNSHSSFGKFFPGAEVPCVLHFFARKPLQHRCGRVHC